MPPATDGSPAATNSATGSLVTASRTRVARTVWICIALFLSAFAWRAVHLPRLQLLHVDEVRFSLPTAREIAGGHPLFFIRGTNYGAPIHEAVAALFFRAFGESALMLRLPVVIFSSLAVVAGFLVLRRVVREPVAVGLALLLAFPASAVTRYGVGAHPVYASFTLIVLGLQAGAWWLDRQRSASAWIAWSLMAGFSLYVLKLAAIPIGLIMLWLGLRSAAFREWRHAVREDRQLRSACWRVFFLMLAAAVLFAPVGYRALTRRATYVPRPFELVLVAVAGILLVLTVLVVSFKGRLPWRHLWPVGAVVGATALFVVPPAWHFQRIELPRLTAAGIEQWPEKRYNLKHAHEWPLQVRLFLDRIVPALVLGRSNQLEGEALATVPWSWKAAFSAALLGTLGFGLGRGFRRSSIVRILYSRSFVLIAPPVVIAAVMFPSWILHSDTCFRYAVPFMTGIWLLGWKCLEPLARSHSRAFAVAVALYVGYCGYDCWANLG